MNNRVSTVLASALLASSLMLGACGSPAESTSADAADKDQTAQTTDSATEAESTSGDESAAQTSSADKPTKDPTRAFVGTWVVAQVEPGSAEAADTDIDAEYVSSLEIDGEGSGSLYQGDTSTSIRWRVEDADTIIVTPVAEDGTTGTAEFKVDYDEQNNAIVMELGPNRITFTADATQ